MSIGALNDAIIAGNLPDNRVARLEEFWHLITHTAPLSQVPYLDAPQNWYAAASRMMTITMGQPGFFRPHLKLPSFNLETAVKLRYKAGEAYNTGISKLF